MEQSIGLQNLSDVPELPYKITRIEANQTNCYLLELEDGYVLIDTGFTKDRQEIENSLIESGCLPDKLKLILVTHGDFDHTGNCAYLRGKYDCRIAMHQDDAGMVERGDFFWNRENRAITKLFGKLLFSLLRMNLKKEDMFSPDILLEDMQDLEIFGIDATVVQIPGHSKGSIGFLTREGDFFCGDLFVNDGRPKRNNLLSNADEYELSIRKILDMKIKTLYPGHGDSFELGSLDTSARGDTL